MWHFLNFFLKLIGNLLFNFYRASTWPSGAHQHDFKSKRRIFRLPQGGESEHARNSEHNH